MQSGIAPWPGTTTRSAAATAAGSEVTSTRARRDMLDRLGDRAQVAHAVIDDSDGVHANHAQRSEA